MSYNYNHLGLFLRNGTLAYSTKAQATSLRVPCRTLAPKNNRERFIVLSQSLFMFEKKKVFTGGRLMKFNDVA